MNTAQDLIDHLLSSTGGGAQDGEHRAVRMAVVHGVREVFQTRQWLWHTKTGTFTTQQVSTTATITSGSKVIVVANPSGFVPGRIVTFGGNYFTLTPKVASVSGNNVTLDHPAAASGSGVTVLVQTFYDLPENIKDIDSLMTETVGTLHFYLSPQEWMQMQINTKGAGEPYYYTVMRSDVDPDRFQIRFVGVPTNGTVVSYTHRYIPPPIRLMGYEPSCRQGTATVSANSTTVTLTGAVLPQGLDNAVIRFGTTTQEADPVGSLNPYVYERRVVSRNSDTSLTLDSAIPAALTNVKYSISDVIDCSPQMYTAVLSGIELWYARMAGKPAGEVFGVFNRDLRLAMENDVVSPMSGRQYVTHYPTPRTMGYHSPLHNDIGG
jgi:hypothetical protein